MSSKLKIGSFIIRAATPADTASLSALADLTFREAYSANTPEEDLNTFISENFSQGAIHQRLTSSSIWFLLIEQGSHVVGYAKLSLEKAPPSELSGSSVELGSLYLLKEFQGQGLGVALFNAALGLASELAFDTVWLSVWEINLSAISFYEKRGMRRVGTMDYIVGSDVQKDVVYCRSLSKGLERD